MFKDGKSLHFMSLMLRSTASLARLLSSMNDLRSSSISFFLCLSLFSKGPFLISQRLSVTIYEFLKV
jgi:hypothetical protein